MKILILGGTRFFGKKLVSFLLEEGHEVTIATRGLAPDNFGDKVQRMIVDRYDKNSLQHAFKHLQFDVIYDQICYASQDASDMSEVMDGRVGKYIFTSSQAVYPYSSTALSEQVFDPYHEPITYGRRNAFSYADGKRLAEATFYQKANFPVLAVRFPYVLGIDDYTERLLFYVEKVHNHEWIYVENLDVLQSFISSSDAARFLTFAKDLALNGPINAASNGELSLKQMISVIEKKMKKEAKICSILQEGEEWSPFSSPASWYMDCSKAKKIRFFVFAYDGLVASFDRGIHSTP